MITLFIVNKISKGLRNYKHYVSRMFNA